MFSSVSRLIILAIFKDNLLSLKQLAGDSIYRCNSLYSCWTFMPNTEMVVSSGNTVQVVQWWEPCKSFMQLINYKVCCMVMF